MGVLDWIKNMSQKIKKGWNTFKTKALPVIGKIAQTVAPALNFIPGVGPLVSQVASGLGQVAEATSGGGLSQGVQAAKQVFGRSAKGGGLFTPSNSSFPQAQLFG
jgi:hypothetical protein